MLWWWLFNQRRYITHYQIRLWHILKSSFNVNTLLSWIRCANWEMYLKVIYINQNLTLKSPIKRAANWHDRRGGCKYVQGPICWQAFLPPAERDRVKYRQLLGLVWGAGMAAGEKMFVTPPESFQLGDKELEVGGGWGLNWPPRNGYAVSRGRRSEDQSAF